MMAIMTHDDAEQSTDEQFQACVELQNKALIELRKARNFRLVLRDYLWGDRLTNLYQRYHAVSHELAELQQTVAECQRELHHAKGGDYKPHISLLTGQLQGLAI